MPRLTDEELEKRVRAAIQLGPKEQERVAALRQAFRSCFEAVRANSEPSRVQSTAYTQLEGALQWALKAAVSDERNGEHHP